MQYIEIQSRKSEKVKNYCRLLSTAKARRKERLFCLEGLRLSVDAALSGFTIEQAFVTEAALSKSEKELEPLLSAARFVYKISEEVAEKMADTVTTQGVFCIAKMKEKADAVLEVGERYVALDNVQNPSNLGAIARTAEALGFKGLLLQDGCDIYNPKAQRASMGSLLRLEIRETGDLAALLAAAPKGILTFATVPDSTAEDIRTLDFSGGAVAVIGNEGNGVSAAVLDAVQKKATIPMRGRAESLNAAAAATITMWEMMK